MQDDNVEAGILGGERTSVADLEPQIRRVGAERAGPLDQVRGRVDPQDLPDARPRREHPRNRTRPAADFEHPRVDRKVDVSQVGPEHFLLLGNRSPQLEDTSDRLESL